MGSASLARWSLALIVTAAAVQSEGRAACLFPRSFTTGSSYILNPACGTHSCGPLGTSLTAEAMGFFWALGAGDPVVGRGIDNGSFPAMRAGDPRGWLYTYPGYPTVMNSTWSDPGIDGCIDFAPGSRCMAVLLTDVSPQSGAGVFAVLTDAPDEPGGFDFEIEGQDIALVDLPAPDIVGQSGSFPGVQVTVRVDEPEGGRYLDPECGDDPLIGYRLYESQRIYAYWHTDRWVPRPDGLGPGGEPLPFGVEHTVDVRCWLGGRAHQADARLAVSLVFESGYETPYLGRATDDIELIGCSCGMDTPDADGDGYCPQIDCDDTDPTVHPFASQRCGTGKSHDCASPTWPAVDPATDTDYDGDGAPCSQDCNESRPDVNPFAQEICNAVDDDCDGHVDEDELGLDSDTDTVPNACDNCIFDRNPGQPDLDGDGTGNACDLDDALIVVSFVDADELVWQEEAGFPSWNLYRGSLAVVRETGVFTQPEGSHALAGRQCDLADPTASDTAVPDVAQAAFYLVTGRTGSIESELGVPGDVARSNDHPCP